MVAVWLLTMPTAPQHCCFLSAHPGAKFSSTCSFTSLTHALLAVRSFLTCLSQLWGRLCKSVYGGTSLDIRRELRWCWATKDFNWCVHSMSVSHWADPTWPDFLITISLSKRPEQTPFYATLLQVSPVWRKAKLCKQTVW